MEIPGTMLAGQSFDFSLLSLSSPVGKSPLTLKILTVQTDSLL